MGLLDLTYLLNWKLIGRRYTTMRHAGRVVVIIVRRFVYLCGVQKDDSYRLPDEGWWRNCSRVAVEQKI